MAKMDIGIDMLNELREKVEMLERDMSDLGVAVMLLAKVTESSLEAMAKAIKEKE